MKKNEYVTPEMEIIEMTMGGILMSSDTLEGDKNPGVPGGGKKNNAASTIFDD